MTGETWWVNIHVTYIDLGLTSTAMEYLNINMYVVSSVHTRELERYQGFECDLRGQGTISTQSEP